MAEETSQEENETNVEIMVDDDTEDSSVSSGLTIEPNREAVGDDKGDVGSDGESSSEEIESYSKSVQTRINKLTAQRREEERQKDEALRAAAAFKEENDKLKQRVDSLSKNFSAQYEGRVNSQLEQAKKAFKDAYDRGDADGLVEAQQAISRITVDAEKLKTHKAKQEREQVVPQQEAQPVPQAQPQQAQPKPDPKAQEWAGRNEWFGQDRVMTVAAYTIHEDLENEGFDLSSDDYYSELDNRLKLEFPQKLGKDSSNGGTARVASADSSASRSTKKGRRAVKLTPSQVAIAKKLGVPLEEYAKHVK